MVVIVTTFKKQENVETHCTGWGCPNTIFRECLYLKMGFEMVGLDQNVV